LHLNNLHTMKIEQIYTGCLAHGAYYIESEGEAAIIDPLRETKPYTDRAERDGAKIKYVLETHFHADFVSGHLDLAKITGAKIVYGPTAKPQFEAHIAADGEVLTLGKVKIKVIHTPGHTMESSCFLLIDENGKEHSLFSGDTLFIGDVGRPDLAQHVIAELTQEKLAGYLFDSLREKIIPLSDDLVVYPGHGAGSACGKNMSNETTDTLGNQKKQNYALQPNLTKADFVKEVLTGLMPPPGYFPQNVLLNINGYENIESVMQRGLQKFSPTAFEALANETNVLVIDIREAEEFGKAFIPNSINVGIDGNFATWVGTLVPDVKQEILLVGSPDRIEEAVTRLARVGFDNCLGYLDRGFESWIQKGLETDSIVSIGARELADRIVANSDCQLLDVRKKSEYESEHIQGVENAPLDFINESMLIVNKQKPVFIYCAAGYRSMLFISILRARGYNNLVNVSGGFKAMKGTEKFHLTEFHKQKTML